MTSEIPMLLLFLMSVALSWQWYQTGDVFGMQTGKLRRVLLLVIAASLIWSALGVLWFLSGINITSIDGGFSVTYESIFSRMTQK